MTVFLLNVEQLMIVRRRLLRLCLRLYTVWRRDLQVLAWSTRRLFRAKVAVSTAVSHWLRR